MPGRLWSRAKEVMENIVLSIALHTENVLKKTKSTFTVATILLINWLFIMCQLLPYLIFFHLILTKPQVVGTIVTLWMWQQTQKGEVTRLRSHS